MIRAAPLLLSFALAGLACRGPTAPEAARLGEPFWLPYGSAVRIPVSTGTLRFVALLEDSRCPSGPLIMCVSAGRVRLMIASAQGNGPVTMHELRLLDAPSAVSIGGHLVQLVDVAPHPGMEAPPVSEYRARFLVTAVR
jgi:hypothetical protein